MARTLWLVVLGAMIGAVILAGRTVLDTDAPAARLAPPPRTDVQSSAPDVAAKTASVEARSDEPRSQAALPSAADDAPDSTLQRFLEVRGIPLSPGAQKDFVDFLAEPRDLGWAPGMEAEFQSELAKTSRTLTESHVECRRSRCLVLLLEPPGAQRDRDQAPPFTRADFDEQVALAQRLNLFGIGTFAVSARDGALVRWQRYFRRCNPDWQCLPTTHEGSLGELNEVL